MASTFRPVPMGQSIVTVSMIVLFGLFVPFVCWGKLADPSHPHTMAHFVFVEPHPAVPALETVAIVHQHGKIVHSHKLPMPNAANERANEQSTPQILFLFTLPLLLIGSPMLLGRMQKFAQHVTSDLNNLSWQSPPPFPPPQSLCAHNFLFPHGMK